MHLGKVEVDIAGGEGLGKQLAVAAQLCKFAALHLLNMLQDR